MTDAPPPDPDDFDATILVRRMGHDFNNLFSIILGGLSLLHEELPPSAWDENSEEIYADVMSATREAAGVIVQLTAWAARQSIEPQDTNINEVIEQVGNLLRRALPESVTLQIVPQPAPVMAWVDRARLLDVLLELAANSRAAMVDGGTLSISTSSCEGKPRISVADNGSGMDTETLLKSKQPYFTTRESGAHRGLGLSVIDGFARASDAQLTITSALKQGTDVTLQLPPARGIGREASA